MYDIVYYYLAVTMTILPSPHQQWSHSTNSLSKLFIAFEDSNITAVEADILMGHIADPSGKSSPSADKPIMAHPQHTQSDLSSCHFLDLVTSSTVNSRNRRTLRKHIKFDFKEMDAVEPTLLALQNLAPIGLAPIGSINETDDSEERQTVFLNADIFPGPGRRFQSGQLDAHDFVEICLRNITQLKERGVAVPFAFSLGFKVDYKSKQRYTPDDCRLMMDIVDRYSLSTEAGTYAEGCGPCERFAQKDDITNHLCLFSSSIPSTVTATNPLIFALSF